MNLESFLDSAGIVMGRLCPGCRRSTIRVSPRALFIPVTIFPRYVSSRYCDTCDKRRLHLHVATRK
jgi:hypothetical protein